MVLHLPLGKYANEHMTCLLKSRKDDKFSIQGKIDVAIAFFCIQIKFLKNSLTLTFSSCTYFLVGVRTFTMKTYTILGRLISKFIKFKNYESKNMKMCLENPFFAVPLIAFLSHF